jgi:cation:H+ antiporter
MGGPLVLATVAYGVTGAVLLGRRSRTRIRSHELVVVGAGGPNPPFDHGADSAQHCDEGRGAVLADPAHAARLAKDQRWFLAVFVVKVALGLVAFVIKP